MFKIYNQIRILRRKQLPKILLKRRRAGPNGPASMKKKKYIYNLCKKAFALFVY